jgi:hypothetical protein
LTLTQLRKQRSGAGFVWLFCLSHQAITGFDSIDKFARKLNPDGDGLGFCEMFNQLLDAATRHDKFAKDTAANQQRKVQQAKTNVSSNSKGKGADKTKTTNGNVVGNTIHQTIGPSCLPKRRMLSLSNAKRRQDLRTRLTQVNNQLQRAQLTVVLK